MASGIYKITNINTNCFYIGSAINIKRRKSTPVICLNNGKRYDAGRDAAKELNVSFQLISKVLKGQRNHTKGYKFIYA